MVRPLPFPLPDPRRATYERQVASLGEVREAIVEVELETRVFEQTLAAFERYYLGRMQHHYALLDRLRVELLEEQLERDAANAELLRELELQRRKAEETCAAIPSEEAEAVWTRQAAPPEAKALYRRVARHVHPDLASSPEEARARHRYMSALNAAFRDGDIDRMQDVLDSWDADAVDVCEEIEEGIARMARLIGRAWKRHARLREELAELRESDLARLLEHVQAAEQKGRDVVADLIENVRIEIEQVRIALARLRGGVAS